MYNKNISKKIKEFNNYILNHRKRILKYAIIAFFTLWLISSIYSKFLPLPEGISIKSETYNVSDIHFLYDINYMDNESQIIEQEIFDEEFRIIGQARKFIIIDMFLFNTDYSEKVRYRNITTEMKDLLIKKKSENPDMDIVFITDPINNFYGDYESKEIAEMKEAGINIVITKHEKLRDINFIYAGLWRSYIQWFGTSGIGWITHPLGRIDEKVTLRSYLKLMNTKANHRKVLIADQGLRVVSIITSANPPEASGKHSNVAIKLFDSISKDILLTESAIESFSGRQGTITKILEDYEVPDTHGKNQIQLITEGKIRESLLEEIKSTESGEEIKMVMFYLSDRRIVKSLLEASKRGVEIKIILDPNKDAFTREKSGIPNRQVAWELVKKSKGRIKIRWYNTQGEQQHSKITIFKKSDGSVIIILGSANLTKRNIGNYNLEMNVKVFSSAEQLFGSRVLNYFEMIWLNKNAEYTVEFEKYKDDSSFKYWLYRFQEATGISSF